MGSARLLLIKNLVLYVPYDYLGQEMLGKVGDFRGLACNRLKMPDFAVFEALTEMSAGSS